MSSAFDYYSETKTGFGFNLKPVLLNRMRPQSAHPHGPSWPLPPCPDMHHALTTPYDSR